LKPAAFNYQRPESIEEALSALGAEHARLIAGGQSLLPLMNMRLARADLLIDISQLEELGNVSAVDDEVRIGAGVTAAAIEDRAVDGPVGEFLSEVAAGIGYRAVRNRGTIGGGVAFADPAGDWPVALMALDAKLEVATAGDSRDVALRDVFTVPFEKNLNAGTLITSISVRQLCEEAKFSYYKFSPTIGEITKAIAVAVFDPKLDFLSLTIGAADAMPVRIVELERTWRKEPSTFAAHLGLDHCRDAIDELNVANSDYKLHCLSVALMRAVAGLQR
jgi:carbon-monoxide dehydrogenase medium subunit